MVSFVGSFGSFEPPRYFWCAFVGMPLLAVGIGMTRFGYMGDVMRYLAAEPAPLAADAFNHVAEGAAPYIRSVSRSVTEGIAGAKQNQPG